ncbi:hypothetical protein CRG98_047568 [Punica granatum]|uniref:Uncharacterized protein n=1 Tax=Punica granatum TaxID=22663 RepID=A0A2I0HK54_PUNGR|nr:hypothetical protein CRG98_047568 [Punica granatum]
MAALPVGTLFPSLLFRVLVICGSVGPVETLLRCCQFDRTLAHVGLPINIYVWTILVTSNTLAIWGNGQETVRGDGAEGNTISR